MPPIGRQFQHGVAVPRPGVASDKNLDQRPVEASGRSVAPITGPKVDRPWGIYSGYFRDPDGHLCEVIWNSGVPPS
jgi:hypothetical protein